MNAAEIRSKYELAITLDMGFPDDLLSVPHTAISVEADRAEFAYAAAYRVVAATVIRCGPHLAELVQPLVSNSAALSLHDFVASGTNRGWTLVDGSDTHIVTADPPGHCTFNQARR